MPLNHETEMLYQVALTLIPGIGPVRAKKLLSVCGSAQSIFTEKRKFLEKIPDIGPFAVASIRSCEVMKQAEKELAFVRKYNIRTLFYSSEEYPERLRSCEDSPILLYTKGEMNLNSPKIISIVGTRKATPYGRQFCEELIRDLKPLKPVIVSGLAYGIDICAHRYAIKETLPTVACLAHGLDKLYPPLHTPVAKEMMHNGGLVTEFVSGTKPDRELFPTRNRLIAGLADCTIVVESDIRGGSVITAQVANGYNRDVFAVPGRYTDRYSLGCNDLIRRNVAAILNSANDLVSYMNWDSDTGKKSRQTRINFDEMSEDDRSVMQFFTDRDKIPLDELSQLSGKNPGSISSLLLDLEFKGYLRSLPGKVYALVSQ